MSAGTTHQDVLASLSSEIVDTRARAALLRDILFAGTRGGPAEIGTRLPHLAPGLAVLAEDISRALDRMDAHATQLSRLQRRDGGA
jgi:hypothetical protein